MWTKGADNEITIVSEDALISMKATMEEEGTWCCSVKSVAKIRFLTAPSIQCESQAGEEDCQEKKSRKGSHCRSQNNMRWSVIISQVLNVSSASARWLETGSAVIGWISWLSLTFFSLLHLNLSHLASVTLMTSTLACLYFVLRVFAKSIASEQLSLERWVSVCNSTTQWGCDCLL